MLSPKYPAGGWVDMHAESIYCNHEWWILVFAGSMSLGRVLCSVSAGDSNTALRVERAVAKLISGFFLVSTRHICV